MYCFKYSKGGNIAANIIQRLALSNRNPLPVLQILIYPQMQYFNFKTPSSYYYSNLPEKASNPDPDHDWDFKSYLQTVGIGNVVEEPSQFDAEIVCEK
jgi:acetyl esterase/lipase